MSSHHRRLFLAMPLLSALASCASIGALMSPYSEKFSCRNSDHGQCIDPDQAYADAVANRASRSGPAVTHDKSLLRKRGDKAANLPASAPEPAGKKTHGRRGGTQTAPYMGYRDSVYRELQGLIDQPVTPMLKAPRTVRTLILPYADRQRPDRLYMPRYVYSITETPAWVVGGYLVDPVSPASSAPVLGQVQERPPGATGRPSTSEPRP